MTKKTFVLAPRLVEGKKWYIEYSIYHESSGESRRHRKDFDLNKIEDLTVRRQVGTILARHLADFVAPAQPEEVVLVEEKGESVKNAVDFALHIKLSTPRKNTHRGYLSISRAFFAWLGSRRYTDIPIKQFTKKHAQAFFDYIRTFPAKPLSGRTLNNYLVHLRALWGELLAREMVPMNPWSGIKMVREEEKKRRPFTDREKKIVARHIEQNDYWLFRALLLQYYCYIRPVEISRLKFKAFDFRQGIITVEAYEAKKWKTRFATIPHSVLHYFADGTFDQQPAHFYIFGLQENKFIAPSPTAAGEARQYKRHRKVLEYLETIGALDDITGLTWYSWKDTGISHHARATSPLSTRDQAGHTDFDMTLTYYRSEKLNSEYHELANDLI